MGSAQTLDLWLYYSDMRAMGGQEMLHCNTMQALSDMDCASCNPEKKAFYRNMVYVHSSFIRTGSPPLGTLRRFAATGKGDYVLNSITGNVTSSRSWLKERCLFWRD